MNQGEERKEEKTKMDLTKVLPKEWIAHIISLTSPKDAIRSSLVCHSLQSVADSDVVWNKFLPPDHLEIISTSTSTSSSSSFLSSLSKKQLYFHLCDNPIVINNGTMSFFLEKITGKKCYMIGARGLSIEWGDIDTYSYWTWESMQESRFSEVALLKCAYWLDIKGKLDTNILTPDTRYAAYFVFKLANHKRGFDARRVVLGVERQDCWDITRSVFLDPQGKASRVMRKRGDGWMEVEMGEFFTTKSRDDGEVACSVLETHDDTVKKGMIVEGIEFRPKGRGTKRESKRDFSKVFSEEGIAHIISLTSPKDASRSSLVCHSLQSAADSDAVWQKFLPPDHLEIISASTSTSSSFLSSLSKKQLYFHLCSSPIIINNGTMSFSLEKLSGKKCYMVGARGLSIEWGDTPPYWAWQSMQESRFPEVGLVRDVYWLDIKGKLDSRILSPKTKYAAYFVFKFSVDKKNFDARPVVLGVERQDNVQVTRSVFLDPLGNAPQVTRERGDGWMEVEMGEFFTENRYDGEVACSVLETHDDTVKKGMIVEGIEFRPKGRGTKRESKRDFSKVFSEEDIISLTSPKDASRSSLVCHSLQSAADSDAVWQKFLPPDHLEIISASTSTSSSFLSSLSKKQLYFHLCSSPIIINNGTMSFSLEKLSGKKCYMVGARGLSIEWGDTPPYWAWQSMQESRFPEVGLVRDVYWLDIKGKLDSRILSPKTKYAAYFVFKLSVNKIGFDARPVVLGVERQDNVQVTRSVFLDPQGNAPQVTRERGDGWMEVEMGEFFTKNRDDGEVVCSLLETHNYTSKKGLIVEGIEFRPKVAI